MDVDNTARSSGNEIKVERSKALQFNAMVMQKLARALLRHLEEMERFAPIRQTADAVERDFYGTVRQLEIDLITDALIRTGGHQTRAAVLLGINVTTLNSKIKRYKIPCRPWRSLD